MCNFDKNLKKLMKEDKLTQDRISDIAKVSRQTVSLWLKGATEPSLQAVLRLSSYFDISVEDLYYKKDIKRNGYKNRRIPIVSDIVDDDIVLSDDWSDVKLVDADFAFIMEDNSMVKHRIRKHDLVMIKETKKIKKNDLVYAVIDDKQFLRRYEKLGDKILLLTDSKKYAPLCLEEKEINIIGVMTGFSSVL